MEVCGGMSGEVMRDMETDGASRFWETVPEAGKVRFTGGRDIEISTLSTTGLGNYDAGKADGSAHVVLLLLHADSFS